MIRPAASTSDWDAADYARVGGFVPALGEAALELLDPQPGEHILDVGCGDGTLTLRIKQMGADVVGIDNNLSMVAAAKAKGLDARLMDAAELKFGDVGGIYDTAAPKTNASKAPGEWQSFDIVFQAPRFDSAGKKTANARFLKVVLNGKVIQENAEVKGPTAASLGGAEKPEGPLMLQGDHGPVAFRNIKLKPMSAR